VQSGEEFWLLFWPRFCRALSGELVRLFAGWLCEWLAEWSAAWLPERDTEEH
jgi:hypothetical protein